MRTDTPALATRHSTDDQAATVIVEEAVCAVGVSTGPCLPIVQPAGASTFVEQLLHEQRSMTAVDVFSREHDTFAVRQADVHPPQRTYRKLMPATAPGPGQQFAFEVDLDSCSGCKACVAACHTLNGLEEHETWRRVGTLAGPDAIQHVTTACHHCEDPGCLKGCPVKAYVKDGATGIVRHLDDQCIGCKYCTMMCPYEVPQYSEQLGIVRKCDMCHQRLSVGEAPACVQACPNEAIRIRIVDPAGADCSVGPAMPAAKLAPPSASETHAAVPVVMRLVPGAPDSAITRPTTVYRTKRPRMLKSSTPQDAASEQVAESHWPLAVMLVATQAAIGCLMIERVVAFGSAMWGDGLPSDVTLAGATWAVVIAGIGLAIAPLHLGQPRKAWRVFLGLRTSWLSREAVILGGFMGLLGGSLTLMWLPLAGDRVPDVLLNIPPEVADTMLTAALPTGVAGLYCSAMIYVATRRSMWRFQRTVIRFGSSALVCGLLAFAAAASIASASFPLAMGAAVIGLASMAAKLGFEAITHYCAGTAGDGDQQVQSAQLVWGPLYPWLAVRMAAAAVAGLLIIAAVLAAGNTGLAAADPVPHRMATVGLVLALLVCMVGELAERVLYFASVVYDRMPGMLR